jgi:hypothetical protein
MRRSRLGLLVLAVALLLIGCKQHEVATTFPFKKGNIWVYTDQSCESASGTPNETLRCGAREDVDGHPAWVFTYTNAEYESCKAWMGEDNEGFKCYKAYVNMTQGESTGEVTSTTPFLGWRKELAVGQTWVESVAVTVPVVRALGGGFTLSTNATLADSVAVLACEDLVLNGHTYPGCYKLRATCWYQHGSSRSQWSAVYLWVKSDLGLVRSICPGGEGDSLYPDAKFELIGTNF